jgi:hypothetical protein
MMELTWRVEKVEADGSARIAQTIDRLGQSIKNPRGEVVVDSAQPPAPTDAAASQLGAAMKPMVGAAFSFTLTAQGDIRDIALSDKTRKALESLPPAAAELLRNDALKFVIPTVPLPAEPVKPGTTWSQKASFTDRLLGSRSLTTEYRYVESENRDSKPLDKIGIKIETMVTPAKDAQVQVDVKLMETRGTILFDRAAGRLVERSDKESARMNITNNGKAVEQVMDGTEVTTLRDGSDPSSRPAPAPAKPVNP